MKNRPALILDANFLLDLFYCDKTLIPLISYNVGQIHLASSVLEEINTIKESDCNSLGIILIQPDMKHLFGAKLRRGTLSFHDHLCLLMAKENGLTCVTNSNPLKQECINEKIPFIWRVDIIQLIVQSGAITTVAAKNLLLKFAQVNPRMYSA